jgi:hypothetical protein
MYGRTAMTCFKHQVFLYGSETITHSNAILREVTELALYVIKLPPSPITGLEDNSSMIKLPYLFKNQRGNLHG